MLRSAGAGTDPGAVPPAGPDPAHAPPPIAGTPARPTVRALAVTAVLMAVVDALGIYLVLGFVGAGMTAVAVVAVVVLVLVNLVYLGRGRLAAKYLTPGLIFLAVFQLFVIAYTVLIAFTNYGDGHNVTRDDAVRTIIANSAQRVPDSPAYRVRVVERDGALALLATDPSGRALLGDAGTPLAPVDDATFDAQGQAVSVPGATTLPLQALLARQAEVTGLSVPVATDVNAGQLRTADGVSAYVYRSTLQYTPETGTLRDTGTGTVYTDNGRGNFVGPDGAALQPGWRSFVGVDNFARALGASAQGALIGVLAWTFVFAATSVVLSFALGTFLALVFNDPRMRGRRVYRVLMILPYSFPLFLSGLVWSGMLNPEFGFVNQVLLGGAEVPWLQDPWLARLSVILVSVWFGFPYFFLVSTGALQAIPEDIQQAARVDGASAWQLFRRIKLPLLLVATSPLLIAAFAFSFNDFNTIFMLTGGGPSDPSSPIDAGSTDILITLVYKQAFVGNSKDYGLASAFAVLIFLVVSVVSVVLFRRTKSLEDVY